MASCTSQFAALSSTFISPGSGVTRLRNGRLSVEYLSAESGRVRILKVSQYLSKLFMNVEWHIL